MGLFKRKDSQYWWMSKTVRGLQVSKSARTADREEAEKRLQAWTGEDSVPGMIAKHTGEDAGIYFIWAVRSELLKIGSSIHLDKRVAQLRLAIPEDIQILYRVKTGALHVREVESAIHGYLKLEGLHVKGEWFCVAESDIDGLVKKVQGFVSEAQARGYVANVLERTTEMNSD